MPWQEWARVEAGLQRSMASYVMMRFGRTSSARHTVGWMGWAGGRLDLQKHKHIYQLKCIVHDPFAGSNVVHSTIYIYMYIYMDVYRSHAKA